jgi:hypothetical protein
MVQSLGVRIGPDASAEAPASSSKCPFTAMIPTEAQGSGLGARDGGLKAPDPELGARDSGLQLPLRWTASAEARLANIPSFVRPMARTGIEQFARERGVLEVDEHILDEARDFFGM